jgi:hypothetical protein
LRAREPVHTSVYGYQHAVTHPPAELGGTEDLQDLLSGYQTELATGELV